MKQDGPILFDVAYDDGTYLENINTMRLAEIVPSDADLGQCARLYPGESFVIRTGIPGNSFATVARVQ